MTLVGTGGSLSPTLTLSAHGIGRELDGDSNAASHRLSPSCRLRKRALPVGQHPRKLAGSQIPLPDALDEGRILPEFPAVKLMWVEDAYWQSNLLRDDADRLRKIGVVGDENCHLEPLRVGVPQQVGGQVHVRALLLRFVHTNLLRRRDVGQVHRNGMRQEVPVFDVQVRNRFERPDVQALIVGRRGIVGPGTDPRREVVKFLDRVRGEQRLCELAEVQPFVRSPFQGAVIDVEPIDINVCDCHSLLRTLDLDTSG